MNICTFFGHRNCPSSIKPKLHDVLKNLIEKEHVDLFYVGNHGAFDAMVRIQLRELEQIYPNIRYAVVLAYLPQKSNEFDPQDYSDTIFPEGIETVPKRFAISWRNRWMLKQADYVVTYVTHSWGGAARFAEMAKRQHKKVINILPD